MLKIAKHESDKKNKVIETGRNNVHGHDQGHVREKEIANNYDQQKCCHSFPYR